MEKKNLEVGSADKTHKQEDDKKVRQGAASTLEGEDELWISEEELCTSDSDADEISKKQISKKREVFLKKQQSLATFNKLKARSSTEQASTSLAESLNLEHKWRPKRGSLKLPSLTHGHTHAAEVEKEYTNKMNKISQSIQKLEQQFEKNNDLMKIEKEARNEIHQQLKMLDGEDSSSDSEFFIEDGDDQDEKKDSNLKDKKDKDDLNIKDFIKRNKELAGKPLHSLTDDEKERLDRMLSEEEEEEKNGGLLPSTEKKKPLNPYSFSDEIQQQISEINEALKAFVNLPPITPEPISTDRSSSIDSTSLPSI